MKEQIEAQLRFAREQEAKAGYFEAVKWDGYSQGLLYVLGVLATFSDENNKYEQLSKTQTEE